eukprot:354411-Chlamydomonas_euryale.AAC.27
MAQNNADAGEPVHGLARQLAFRSGGGSSTPTEMEGVVLRRQQNVVRVLPCGVDTTEELAPGAWHIRAHGSARHVSRHQAAAGTRPAITLA